MFLEFFFFRENKKSMNFFDRVICFFLKMVSIFFKKNNLLTIVLKLRYPSN